MYGIRVQGDFYSASSVLGTPLITPPVTIYLNNKDAIVNLLKFRNSFL